MNKNEQQLMTAKGIAARATLNAFCRCKALESIEEPTKFMVTLKPATKIRTDNRLQGNGIPEGKMNNCKPNKCMSYDERRKRLNHENRKNFLKTYRMLTNSKFLTIDSNYRHIENITNASKLKGNRLAGGNDSFANTKPCCKREDCPKHRILQEENEKEAANADTKCKNLNKIEEDKTKLIPEKNQKNARKLSNEAVDEVASCGADTLKKENMSSNLRIEYLQKNIADMRKDLSEIKQELIPPNESMRRISLEQKIHNLTELVTEMKQDCCHKAITPSATTFIHSNEKIEEIYRYSQPGIEDQPTEKNICKCCRYSVAKKVQPQSMRSKNKKSRKIFCGCLSSNSADSTERKPVVERKEVESEEPQAKTENETERRPKRKVISNCCDCCLKSKTKKKKEATSEQHVEEKAEKVAERKQYKKAKRKPTYNCCSGKKENEVEVCRRLQEEGKLEKQESDIEQKSSDDNLPYNQEEIRVKEEEKTETPNKNENCKTLDKTKTEELPEDSSVYRPAKPEDKYNALYVRNSSSSLILKCMPTKYTKRQHTKENKFTRQTQDEIVQTSQETFTSPTNSKSMGTLTEDRKPVLVDKVTSAEEINEQPKCCMQPKNEEETGGRLTSVQENAAITRELAEIGDSYKPMPLCENSISDERIVKQFASKEEQLSAAECTYAMHQLHIDSSHCIFCARNDKPILAENLVTEVYNLLNGQKTNEIALTVLLQADNLYHINISNIITGESFGCLFATEAAIDVANKEQLFEKLLTFFIVDTRNTMDQRNRILGHTFEFIKK